MSADWQSLDWGELLAALRRDLQLDPRTDLLQPLLITQTAVGPVGSIVAKIAIANAQGTVTGYVPVYSAIP